MKQFRVPLLCLVCLALGLLVGGYVGSYRPWLKNPRALLQSYTAVRESFQLTDAEMIDFKKNWKSYLETMKRQDEFAATVALGEYQLLERGDTNTAKESLCKVIAGYYQSHRYDGDTNVVWHIETLAATNATFSNAIRIKL